jgi:hypothetical protein
MDQLIAELADQNQNPSLRNELVHFLWNSSVGEDFDSMEELSSALTEGTNVRLIIAARERLGLPIIE